MHTRTFVRHALAFAILACLVAPNANAQTIFYPNDATINTAVLYAVVGYANGTDYNRGTNGTSPTVNLVTGGNIYDMRAFNSSTINVFDGNIRTYLRAFNSSTANFSGGSIESELLAYDNSTVNVSGGSISYGLLAYNNSNVNVSGGSISNGLLAYNNSTVNVSGGSINLGLIAGNNSTVNVSGGIGSVLFASGASSITVAGGSFSNYLLAYENSNVNVNGGTFGQADGINFFDQTSGVFTFVGSNLTATNARTDFKYGGTDYDLSGTLFGGTNLSGYVLNVADGSTFTLQNASSVPEPGSVALLTGILAIGGMAGIRRVRRPYA